MLDRLTAPASSGVLVHGGLESRCLRVTCPRAAAPPKRPWQENELAGSWSRRGLLGVMLGGTVAYGLAVRTVAGPPLAAVDKQRNIALLKTAGGNTVAATQVGGWVGWARQAPGQRVVHVGACERSATPLLAAAARSGSEAGTRHLAWPPLSAGCGGARVHV